MTTDSLRFGSDRFGASDNWHGGFYELAIQLGQRDDDRLAEALAACWTFPDVDGPYMHRDTEPGEQPRVAPTLANLEVAGHLRGAAALPVGRVVCGTCCIREDASGIDWLDFYLPIGSLAKVDDRTGGYPFGPDDGAESLRWRTGIDEWLALVGQAVFAMVPFMLGIIGCEASGEVYAEDIGPDGPENRGVGYLIPSGEGLDYLPATS